MRKANQDESVKVINPGTRSERNSSIELLRIITMFLIVFDHYIIFNEFSVADAAISKKRFFYRFFEFQGNAGTVIFFLISAWFLSQDKQPSIKISCRKVWILEKDLLFYSVVFFVIAKIRNFDVSSTMDP